MLDINVDLLKLSINVLIKKTSGGTVKKENIQNKELAKGLHKSIIRKFEKRKVHPNFIDIVWATNLADMHLLSTFNKGFRFLICVIDIYSKYAWIIPLKDKNGIRITNAFQLFFDETNCKSNKIWVDKGSEFYNRSMKSFLPNDSIEMDSAHNEGKSFIAERFIRTLKNKIYKYMNSISKNVYTDIVNTWNKTYYAMMHN